MLICKNYILCSVLYMYNKKTLRDKRYNIFRRIPLKATFTILICVVMIPIIISGALLNQQAQKLIVNTHAESITSSLNIIKSTVVHASDAVLLAADIEKKADYLIRHYQFTMYVVNGNRDVLYKNSFNLPASESYSYPLPNELDSQADYSSNNHFSIKDTFRGNLLYTGFKITDTLMAYFLFPISQFTGSAHDFWHIILGTLLCSFILIILSINIVGKRVVIPLKKLLYSIRNPSLPTRISPYIEWENEIGKLCLSYSKRAEDYRNKLDKINDFNNQKRKFEFEALQNQINSHFIYNTLNNIQWLALAGRTNDVITTAKSLFCLLQAFCQNDNEMVTIEEELGYVESYLIAQKIRFEEFFNYEFNLDPLLTQMKIPKFIIQPIVENSIYHGFINCNKKNGIIKVSVERRGHRIDISVYDNGIGIKGNRVNNVINNKNKSSGRYMGVALGNVNKRIKLLCGKEYGIGIRSKFGEYSIVKVTLPIMV